MAGYIKSAGWEIDAETGDKRFLVTLEFSGPPNGFTIGDIWDATPVDVVKIQRDPAQDSEGTR